MAKGPVEKKERKERVLPKDFKRKPPEEMIAEIDAVLAECAK